MSRISRDIPGAQRHPDQVLPQAAPGSAAPAASAVPISSPGTTGSRMAAANRRSLVPKKWWTRAGSTPASAAMPRIVAPS